MNSNCKYTSYCSCSSISSNIFHMIVHHNIGDVSFEANFVQDRKIVIWSGCKCYRFPILPSVPHFPHQIFSVTRHPIPMFLVYLKKPFFSNDIFGFLTQNMQFVPLQKIEAGKHAKLFKGQCSEELMMVKWKKSFKDDVK